MSLVRSVVLAQNGIVRRVIGARFGLIQESVVDWGNKAVDSIISKQLCLRMFLLG